MPQVLVPKIIVAASDAPSHWKQRARFVCDGTSDDVQIQAACDALPASGGKVELSPGTFTFSSSVEPSSYQTIEGDYDGTVLVKGTGAAIRFFEINGTNLSSGAKTNVIVRNLRVSIPAGEHYGLIGMDYCKYCAIENIYYTATNSASGATAISVSYLQYCQFKNIYCFGLADTSSTVFFVDSTDCFIDNIYGDSCQDVVDIAGAERMRVSNVTALNSRVAVEFGNVRYSTVDNVYAENCENIVIVKTEATAKVITSGPHPGSINNHFTNLTGRNLTRAGIEFQGGTAGAQSENQKLDNNTFDGLIYISTVATTAAVILTNGDNSSEPYTSGFRLSRFYIDTNSTGISFVNLRNSVIENGQIKTATSGIACGAPSGTANRSQNNCYSNLSIVSTGTTTGHVPLVLRFEERLNVNNVSTSGGGYGMLLNDIARAAFTNCYVHNTQFSGIVLNPCSSVQMTNASGSIALAFENVIVENSNTVNGFNYAWLITANGTNLPSSTIRNMTFTNCGIEDTQGTPTARDMNFVSSNGGIFNRVRRRDNWRYDSNSALTIATGNGNTINGIGTESANAETPTASAWDVGTIVNFTDSGDGSGTGTYVLVNSSTWRKIQ